MRAVQTLREGLLDGVSVLVAGGSVQVDALGAAAATACAEVDSLGAAAATACAEVDSLGAAAATACAEVGARVFPHPSPIDGAAIDGVLQAIVAETGGIDLLVLDGASLFAAAPACQEPLEGGREGDPDRHAPLRACLETAWRLTRAVATLAFLPGGRGGRIVYLAPASDAGEHADAARAGLENLSRTLSIEWARHGITLVTIAPGGETSAGEVAALVAYLASPAGAYFSGCQLDLGGV